MIFISPPSLFPLPARLPGATPQKVAVILTLYWTGAYILQMIIYAIVVHLANTVSWTVAMMFTALYSLTFLVGTFLLPDFDRPAKQPPAGTSPLRSKKRPPSGKPHGGRSLFLSHRSPSPDR